MHIRTYTTLHLMTLGQHTRDHTHIHTNTETEIRKYSTAARKTAYNLSGLYSALRCTYFLIGLEAKTQQSFSGTDKFLRL